jgi:hypothetical protein
MVSKRTRLALPVGRLAPLDQKQEPGILRGASANRPSGHWNDDDFDVLANGTVVGRIFKANAASVGSPWMWTLAFGRQKIARRHTATLRRARLP